MPVPAKYVGRGELGLLAKQVYRYAPLPALRSPADRSATVDTLHESWLLYAIQGMVNRQEPILWLGDDGLMGGYLAEQGYEFIDRRSADYAQFLKAFAPAFNGIVLYSIESSDNLILALNIANLNFCLPVAEPVYHQYRDCFGDLPVVLRLADAGINRANAYEWLIREVLPKCDRLSAFSMNQSFPDNTLPAGERSWEASGDIAFRFKSFIFNLSGLPAGSQGGSAVEAAAFTRIMEQLQPPAMVFGWNTAEAVYSRYGHMMGHCQNAANTSFIASVPLQGKFPLTQDAKPKVERPEKKLYIAFVSNEGDTLRLFAHGFWGAWNRPERGSVPMNWAISPAYVRYVPALFEYYYRTKTPNDYFCFGPTGAGYVHTDLMPPDRQDIFYAETERLSREYLDLHEVIGWGCNNLDAWQKLAALPCVNGLYPKPNMADGMSGRLMHLRTGSKTVPVLRESFGHYWYTRTAVYNKDVATQLTPEKFAAEIHEQYANLKKPAYLVLYSLEGEAPKFIQEVVSKLDPAKAQVVDLGTMSYLMAQTPSDVADVPRGPAVRSPRVLSPSLIRNADVWVPLANSKISVVPQGLRIELAENWGGVALQDVRLPARSSGLVIKFQTDGGNFEPRAVAHFDPSNPTQSSECVGIQGAVLAEGPYPGGVFRSSFDPRIVTKIGRGEVIPQLKLVLSGLQRGDVVIISEFKAE